MLLPLLQNSWRGLGLALAALCVTGNIAAGTDADPVGGASVALVLERLPLRFEPLGSEANAETDRFIGRGLRHRVLLEPASVHLRGAGAQGIELRFVDGNTRASARAAEELSARSHYLRGSPGGDRVDVPTFARVRFSDVYPGIDVDYYGKDGHLEFDLIVRPEANIANVRLAVDGSIPSRDASGNLRIEGADGSIILHRPVSYQTVDGMRRLVDSEFFLTTDHYVGIAVGSYDPAEPLIVDPVLTYASYVGGKGFDLATAIAIDPAGNMYVAGSSASPDFPLASAYDRNLAKGDTDVFIAKINAAGSALVYSTYLGGGSATEMATGIAVDKSGNVYVTGNTSGSDFPTTPGAYQAGTAGGGAFVAKLGPSGNTLVYSTYVRSATATSLAVDGDGNAHITGSALPAFVTTAGALQPVSGNASGTNAFVLKLNPAGSQALYATFLGGSGNDVGNAIAVDGSGSAYVAGGTTSPNFPVVAAMQIAAGGARDGFVAKLAPTGNALKFSTYLGGSLDDAVNAIAIDANGGVHLAGETYSTNFPVKDPYQSRKSGNRLIGASLGNAFFAKMTGDGAALVYASFLGGEICPGYCQPSFPVTQFAGDSAYAVAVDAQGNAYVGGFARTYQFPLLDSLLPQKTNDFFTSSFVTKIGHGGGLLYSTFVRTSDSFGWTSRNDVPAGSITGIAVDSAGAAYLTSNVDQIGTFQPTSSALQRTFGGYADGTIFKLSGSPATIDLASSAGSVDALKPLTLTATISGATLSGAVEFRHGAFAIGSAAISGGRAILTTTLPAGIYALTAVYVGGGVNIDSAVLYQVVDNPLDCN